MPVHSTLDPIDAATKAVDALLTALDGNPAAGAAAAYRAALARHGRQLVDTAGPEGLSEVLRRIRVDAADKAQAEQRERIVLQAWNTLLGSKDKAA